MDSRPHAALPAHYEVSPSQYLISALSIAAAFGLLVLFAAKLAAASGYLTWWVAPSFLFGVLLADFLSGVVHWFADTWGRDDMPVLGRRLLVPFRIHHVNPDDLIRRSFVDANGDVALVVLPVLVAAVVAPIRSTGEGALATFLLGLCGVGVMTNQIHQWAHMPSPPLVVRVLQRSGLILPRRAHARHHASPYDASYCIATGWCNGVLERIAFFRRIERWVTALTGIKPRHDDDRYREQFANRAGRGGGDVVQPR